MAGSQRAMGCFELVKKRVMCFPIYDMSWCSKLFFKYVCIYFPTKNEFQVVISVLIDSSSPYTSPYLHGCLNSDGGVV